MTGPEKNNFSNLTKSLRMTSFLYVLFVSPTLHSEILIAQVWQRSKDGETVDDKDKESF